jgi:hypothetical protein
VQNASGVGIHYLKHKRPGSQRRCIISGLIEQIRARPKINRASKCIFDRLEG